MKIRQLVGIEFHEEWTRTHDTKHGLAFDSFIQYSTPSGGSSFTKATRDREVASTEQFRHAKFTINPL
jgi:hypothetical protein